ncbi:MAG TPA: hypothetical protein VNZ53_26665 [Steroidobacteraceae bacterium]|nr:hypothetical protein [Steroidobacteraceae bacterium]
MTQTKLGSIAEAWANIAVGFGVNFTANMLILPLFGFHSLTLKNNFIIGMLYTVISLARSYILRRWFNGLKFGNRS